MAAIAAAFPAKRFAHVHLVGAPVPTQTSPTPIFIVGMPRSGTTLVEQILISHLLVRGGGERGHMPRLVQGLPDAYPAGVLSGTSEQIAGLGRDCLAATTPAARDARVFTDKLPGNFLYIGLIHLVLPHVRIGHCRRHPVETCLLCYATQFTTGHKYSHDLAELGTYYLSYAALMAYWRAVMPATHFIEINYEAVVDNLEAEFRKLTATLLLCHYVAWMAIVLSCRLHNEGHKT